MAIDLDWFKTRIDSAYWPLDRNDCGKLIAEIERQRATIDCIVAASEKVIEVFLHGYSGLGGLAALGGLAVAIQPMRKESDGD